MSEELKDCCEQEGISKELKDYCEQEGISKDDIINAEIEQEHKEAAKS